MSAGVCVLQTGGVLQLTGCDVRGEGTILPVAFALVGMSGGELVSHAGTRMIGFAAASGLAVVAVGSLVLDPDTTLQDFALPIFDPQIVGVIRYVPHLDGGTQGLGGTASGTLDLARCATARDSYSSVCRPRGPSSRGSRAW